MDFNKKDKPSDEQIWREVQFAVIGCGPSKPDEERQLAQAMSHDQAVKDGAFLVHLGNAETHRSSKDGEPYEWLAEYLRLNERPTLVLPGRTEWNGAHDHREMFRKHFLYFETLAHQGDRLSENPLHIQRQTEHPENFTFVKDGVLFIGIDLPGGDNAASVPGFDDQLAACIRWVESCMDDAHQRVRAAVIFAHAFPERRHKPFSLALQCAVRDLARPVLYLHADSYYLSEDRPHTKGPKHTKPSLSQWCQGRPWPNVDLLRVRTEPFGSAPPLRVCVRTDGSDLFELDRQYFRGPYLNCGTPHSMTIIWRTDRRIRPEVRIGRQLVEFEQHYTREMINYRTTETSSGGPKLHSSPEGAWQYDVKIESLEPATKYYYAIYDDGKLLVGGDEHHYFHTSPLAGTPAPLRFWIFGDSGKNNQPQADVHRAMLSYTNAQRHPIELFLHCGDMAYTQGKDTEFQSNFFRPYQETLRHTVLWPTMSNHEGQTSDGNTDSGPYYDAFILPKAGEAGGVPSGTSSYYGFDYGQVHFICLCSFSIRLDSDSDQAKWLRADLEHVRKQGNIKWIIAYFHHPAFTKGSHDSDTEKDLIDVREHLMPILEEGGVDLIFCGHSHTYERSMLIDRAYGTPVSALGCTLDDGDGDPEGDGPYRKSAMIEPHEGTVQIVCGCGGANISRRGTSPVMKRVLMEHGSVLVDVEGHTLTAIMLNAEGVIRDRFAIVREGQINPMPIARPRQLPEYVSYSRMQVRIGLDVLPNETGAATATLVVQPASANVEATLEWQTEGTHWQVDPLSLRFNVNTEYAARHSIRMRCTGDLFPLPRPAIVFHSPEREERKPYALELPAYRTVALRQLPQCPNIDGYITREEIAGLERQSDFVDFRGTEYAHEPTVFYAGLSENRLYVAVTCSESEMGGLFNSNPKGDEAHFSDDCIELFLQREDSKDFYHFVVNAYGQRLDAKNGWKPKNRKWSGDWESAVRRQTDRWTAELLIDLSMFDEPVKPGQVLLINVARNHAIGRQYSQWSYTGQNSYATHCYGKAVIGEKIGE